MMNEMDIVRIGINTILLHSALILIDLTLPKLMQCDRDRASIYKEILAWEKSALL